MRKGVFVTFLVPISTLLTEGNLREDSLAYSSICYSGEGMATMKERSCDLVFLMMSDQKAEYLDRH